MLFNSYAFLLAFLPCVWLAFEALRRTKSGSAAFAWLVVASFFFYGYWDERYVVLLGASVGVNYAFGTGLIRIDNARGRLRRALLVLGVSFNLALLGYFKYTNFLLDSLAAVAGLDLAVGRIALPIGISFYSFQQIAFQVDAYRREVADANPLRYALFVSFFPQLIAGPIVHHREMMPQLARRSRETVSARMSIGLTIFVIGLFKKVMLADSLALQANPVYALAASGGEPTLIDAWAGTLAYSFQIYFDFSGYSDMAIGLGRMFGLRLPVNFASPYKATSIIDFWRRWHITLSRFLRDYLYIPLGGNRRGAVRRHLNVFLTMFLGGIWHGAGWTFALWGALHGVLLIANHLLGARLSGRPPQWLARCITFACVVVAWVPFRAEGFGATLAMYRGMLGLNGVQAEGLAVSWHVAWLLPLLLAGVWILPNTQEWMRGARPTLPSPGYPASQVPANAPGWRWSPAAAPAVAMALILASCMLKLGDISEFIYFRF